jgi:hypothetical protein
MESSICVAVITGLPARLHAWMIFFCASGMRSVASCTPRSPRATMIPSATEMMPSMLSRPSSFSILAMMRTFEPKGSMKRWMDTTSAGELTKLAAM